MPYKLNNTAPKELTEIFNSNVLAYSGVTFRNEVPICKRYKEHFEKIDLSEYYEIRNRLITAVNGNNANYTKKGR